MKRSRKQMMTMGVPRVDLRHFDSRSASTVEQSPQVILCERVRWAFTDRMRGAAMADVARGGAGPWPAPRNSAHIRSRAAPNRGVAKGGKRHYRKRLGKDRSPRHSGH